MRVRARHPGSSPRGGFTLAEVAVTIVIVGIGLVLVLQGLHSAKLTAAQTHNFRLAHELGMLTLGQIESGLFWDEVDGGRVLGSYSDEGFPEFSFEAVFGDESFLDYDEDGDFGNIPFDNWYDEDDGDPDDEAEQPYEKIQVKITFPKIQERKNELVLVKWVAWDQVHEPLEEDADSGDESGSEPQ